MYHINLNLVQILQKYNILYKYTILVNIIFCKYIMALTPWNKFVSKIYQEGKKANKDYKFKDALKDASRRKSEMNAMGNASARTSSYTKSIKKNKSRKQKKKK